MTKLFILVRKKNSKRFIGAIPAKKNSTKKSLQALVRKKLKKGFKARVVSLKQLKSVIKRSSPLKKRVVKRKVVRKRRKK